MRFLVTGGAGYIGSVVARGLVEAGHGVTVFDDLSTGSRGAVPEGARLFEGDLLDAGALREVFSGGFDGAFHLAALSAVGESVREPERYYRTNVCGTLNLLEAMLASGTDRLVFSSTAAVYGEPEAVPVRETAPTRPANPYGASKLAAEALIGAGAAAHGLAATSLRYFNVAGKSRLVAPCGGPAPKTQLIPIVLEAAAGPRPSVEVFGTDYPTPDGTAVRDFIHVEDVARAHLLALAASRPGEHRVYNLGNGSGFSVREVVEAARRITARRIATVDAPRRPGDPAVVVASGERIREELGWQPEKPSLDAIVADAWERTRLGEKAQGEGGCPPRAHDRSLS